MTDTPAAAASADKPLTADEIIQCRRMAQIVHQIVQAQSVPGPNAGTIALNALCDVVSYWLAFNHHTEAELGKALDDTFKAMRENTMNRMKARLDALLANPQGSA